MQFGNSRLGPEMNIYLMLKLKGFDIIMQEHKNWLQKN